MVAARDDGEGDVNRSSAVVPLLLVLPRVIAFSRDRRGVSLGLGHKPLRLLIQLPPPRTPPCLLLRPPTASSLTAVAARPHSK